MFNDNKKETFLDSEYRIYVFNKTFKTTYKEKKRWDLYNEIINELLWMGAHKFVNEIKYRITDGEEPPIVIKESLSTLDIFSYNLHILLSYL